MVDMRTVVASVTLPNPVLTASGCAAAGRELDQFFDVSALGAVVTKSIMGGPRSGRPTPRMAETPSGMLNSIGLQGPGIDGLLAADLPWLTDAGGLAFASPPALQVNTSCPDVESGGEVFARDPVAASDVISAVRAVADPAHPVYAKLS